MPLDHLDAALDAGALIVTPNNRLARQVVLHHDTAQRAAGRRTWRAARALPWRALVDALWAEAIAQGDAAEVPLSAPATLQAWQSIVEADGPPLLDARGAARAAAEAFALFHAHREPGERWQAWAGNGATDDAAVFARWAGRYRELLRARGALDRAELPDRLAARGAAWPDPAPIVLLGFAALSPQQQRLLDALAARGTPIVRMAPRRRDEAQRRRVECATSSDELLQALAYARACAERDPAARIGIVVVDLPARRAELLALAEEILAPARLAPLDVHAPRPYGISLGVALSSVPLVALALDLIALATTGLDAPAAGAALRSPYLPGAVEAWTRRAYVERVWREQGRRVVRIDDAAGTLTRFDPTFAQRLRTPLSRRPAAPRDWIGTWSTWLEAVGWPGTRPLDSAEWQARDAWQDLLRTFAGLGDVAPSLDGAAALRALRALAEETVWSPQSGPAPVQILGVLEATGLTFDALWLAGFSAQAWPPAPRPNPLLPLAWQRRRGVPRASAARELAYARELSEGFAHAAAEVVVSHARETIDAPQTPSPLFAAWPVRALDAPVVRLGDVIAAAPRARPLPWHDTHGPALPLGADAGGGTGLIESQSACPFQAFARYRLRTEAWPVPGEGLTPIERGNLLHWALAAFWLDLREHAALAAMDPAALEMRVAHCVASAHAKLPAGRWRSLAPAIAAGEAQRLTQTLVDWLLGCERPRPPFAVSGVEIETELALGGVRLRFRIDRVDALEPEGVAIIDYKSGRAVPPSAWFRARPEGTQLGLYALAQRAAAPTRPVRAVAYAQLKAGEQKVLGIAADAMAWPGLTPVALATRGTCTTWRDAEDHWTEALAALGQEYRRGEARVTPRNRHACERCDLQPLCRIRGLHDEAARGATPPERDE